MIRMKSLVILLCIPIIFLLSACGSGGSGSGSGFSETASKQEASHLSFSISVDEFMFNDEVTLVDFKTTAKNSGPEPITITFPTSPVSFDYVIYDASGDVIDTFEYGVLASLESVTISANSSVDWGFKHTCAFLIDGNHLVENTISYYLNNEMVNTSVSTLF